MGVVVMDASGGMRYSCRSLADVTVDDVHVFESVLVSAKPSSPQFQSLAFPIPLSIDLHAPPLYPVLTRPDNVLPHPSLIRSYDS